jgi:hypothetical protein
MPFLFKRLVLFLSITAAFAADKEAAFHPDAAARYSHHQTNAQVTIGVDPYVAEEKARSAFGKLNPYQYGVLPVLVVVQNDSNKTIRLDRIHAVYNGPQGDKVDATPAKDVRYTRGPNRPSVPTSPIPKIGKGGKNPLNAWEIEGRAFAAKMLPAGQSASGFFYFQTGLQRGATIYLSGLADAATNHELFYYEIPLE